MGDSTSNASLPITQSACTALMAGPSMSRRTLLKMGAVTGALAFLGAVFPSRHSALLAYADEKNQVVFELYILSPEEIPVMSYDVTKKIKKPTSANNRYEPLGNVAVTIESTAANQSINLTTSAAGFAVFNAKKLSTDTDVRGSKYNFFGKISAQKEGYCAFHDPRHYCESGTAPAKDGSRSNVIQIPCMPLMQSFPPANDPYARTIAIDECDVQYCESTMAVVKGDKTKHPLVIEVVGFKPSEPVSVSWYIGGKDAESRKVRETKTATLSAQQMPGISPASYNATVDFGATFDDVEPGSVMYVSYKLGKEAKTPEDEEETIEVIQRLRVTFTQGHMMQDSGYKDNVPIPKFAGIDTTGMPDWLIGLHSLNCALPICPVKIFCDCNNKFGISATLFSMPLLKRRNGKNELEGGAWANAKSISGLSKEKTWKKFSDDLNKLSNTAGVSPDGKEIKMDHGTSAFGASKVMNKFDASVEVNAMAYGQLAKVIDDNNVVWEAGLAITGKLGISFVISQQIMIAFYPVFWCADFSASLSLALASGIKIDQKNDNFNVSWGNYGPNGGWAPGSFVITIYIEAGLSLGIGIKGVISAAIRGYGWFKIALQFKNRDAKATDYPHIKISAAGAVQAVFEMLFITKSINIVKPKVFDIYESGKNKKKDGKAQLTDETLQLAAEDALADEDAFEGAYWLSPQDLLDSASFDAMQTSDENGEATLAYEPIALPEGTLASEYGELSSDERNPYSGDKYDPTQGLKPAMVTRLDEGAWGSPRLKMIYGNKTFDQSASKRVFFCRVVTAKIGEQGVARTRIQMSTFNILEGTWGDPKIIEFNIDGVNPWDRDDVDFDMDVYDAAAQTTQGTVLTFAITSIVNRESIASEGDDAETIFKKNRRQQFVTVVNLFVDSTHQVTNNYTVSFYDRVERGIATFAPRILVQDYPGKKGDAGYPCAFVLYCYTMDTTGELGAETGDIAGFMIDYNRQSIVFENSALLGGSSPVDSALLLSGSFDVSNPRREAVKVGNDDCPFGIIAWSATNSARDEALSFLYPVAFNDQTAQGFGALVLPHVSQVEKRSVQMPSKDAQGNERASYPFVYTRDESEANAKQVCLVKYDTSTHTVSSVKEEKPANQGFFTNQNYFASNDGSKLYATSSFEGEIPALDESELAAVQEGAILCSNVYSDGETSNPYSTLCSDEGGMKRRYQLLETRWIEGLAAYHEFYPIAQLDFCPDFIDIVYEDSKRRDFIMGTVSNIEALKDGTQKVPISTIYHVMVKSNLAMHPIAVTPAVPFAAPKDKMFFDLEVRNTGNGLISSFCLSLNDSVGNKIFDKKRALDLKDRMLDPLEGGRQELDENDSPKRDENDEPIITFVKDARDKSGILWPGATRIFRFSFTVPDYKETGKSVKFATSISGPLSSAKGGKASLASDEDVFEFDEELAYLAVDDADEYEGMFDDQFYEDDVEESEIFVDETPVSFDFEEEDTDGDDIPCDVTEPDFIDDDDPEPEPTPTPTPSPTPSPTGGPTPSPTGGNSGAKDIPAKTGDPVSGAAVAALGIAAAGAAMAATGARKAATACAEECAGDATWETCEAHEAHEAVCTEAAEPAETDE